MEPEWDGELAQMKKYLEISSSKIMNDQVSNKNKHIQSLKDVKSEVLTMKSNISSMLKDSKAEKQKND